MINLLEALMKQNDKHQVASSSKYC